MNCVCCVQEVNVLCASGQDHLYTYVHPPPTPVCTPLYTCVHPPLYMYISHNTDEESTSQSAKAVLSWDGAKRAPKVGACCTQTYTMYKRVAQQVPCATNMLYTFQLYNTCCACKQRVQCVTQHATTICDTKHTIVSRTNNILLLLAQCTLSQP